MTVSGDEGVAIVVVALAVGFVVAALDVVGVEETRTEMGEMEDDSDEAPSGQVCPGLHGSTEQHPVKPF